MDNETKPTMSMVKARIASVLWVSMGLWGGLVVALAILFFLPKEYFGMRWVFFPISLIASATTYFLFISPSYVSSICKTLVPSKQVTITIIFYNYLRYRYIRVTLCLAVLTITYYWLILYHLKMSPGIIPGAVTSSLVIFLLLRLFAIERRVVTGHFGSNSDEAKELIAFILAHSEEVDFFDDDGTPKKGFLPEVLVSNDFVPNGHEVKL